jgi:uncharacterized protein YbjT (DUF2867 family)
MMAQQSAAPSGHNQSREKSMAKNNDKIILVTGATGQQGGAAMRHLREKGFPIRALTRDPGGPKARVLVGRGTEVVQGDLNDPASLTRAVEGVHGVYSVQASAGDPELEVRQGRHLTDAAKQARVSHFVYSSVGSADRKTGVPHFESKFRIEEQIRSSGLRYTILRPVFFMENWLHMRDAIEAGTVALPLSPETRLQMIAVDDIGVFITMAFEHPGHWQGRAVDLAGDELAMTEIADALGRMTGRNVSYAQVRWDQFEQKAGPDMTLMYRWFQDVGYSVDIAALRQEHPNLMSFQRWLQGHWRPRVQTA